MASFLKFFILFWNSNVRINKLLNILEYIKINLILNKWVSISQFASNHDAKITLFPNIRKIQKTMIHN